MPFEVVPETSLISHHTTKSSPENLALCTDLQAMSATLIFLKDHTKIQKVRKVRHGRLFKKKDFHLRKFVRSKRLFFVWSNLALEVSPTLLIPLVITDPNGSNGLPLPGIFKSNT